MSKKYKFHNPDGIYFINLTITDWVDLFTKPEYSNIVLNSLKFCQENKGLVLHAWCIMPSHLHLIVSRNGNKSLSEIIRDFKRFTSIEIVKNINKSNDSRKNWMIDRFKVSAEKIKRVQHFKVWQDGNHPVEFDSNELLDQRLEYTHQNPVKSFFVWEAEDYVYSSAIDYAGEKGLLDIDPIN